MDAFRERLHVRGGGNAGKLRRRRGRRAGGDTVAGRSPLPRSLLAREPGVLRPAAGLPAVVAVHARAGGRGRPRPAGRGQGAIRRRRHDRRARPHKHAGRKPRSPAPRDGDRRHERHPWHGALPGRPDHERRPAEPGRPVAVRARPRPGCQRRPGRVPERADRADPVSAHDAHRACGAAPAEPALDQQVLRARPVPGPQLRRMGGRPRPHRVRHQLRQSGLGAPRFRAGRLPARWPAVGPRRRRSDHALEAHKRRGSLPRGDDRRRRGSLPGGRGRPTGWDRSRSSTRCSTTASPACWGRSSTPSRSMPSTRS